ncbi:MAG: efflux transporter outer membrane subunit [Candidatus Krumholzibacteria bacterium]|nr:efflux transporter outer membrane subunit [Candidatus Krumholzibacteria bacterium]MDH4336974.1 efflux transporter outer membrane subunit [Candidatus Krumholzibacteria bacterium]MDH5269731.1 efflux transporter outer membrane subunit [Candidatus Krumholzibacteria bacterium]
MKRTAWVAGMLLVAGCSVGPNYQRPDIESPESWRAADSTVFVMADSTSLALADTAWWELFGDTVLTSLVAEALTANYDIRIAAGRVDELMGLYGVTRSDYFPKLDAQFEGSRGQRAFPGDQGDRSTDNYFDVSLGASWEIDIWGRIRRANEAARANLLAAEAGRRAVVLSVASLVATSYVDLLALDDQLDIARRTAATREQSVDLMRNRYDHGDVSEIELRVMEAEYWRTVATIPVIEQRITEVENALSVLLGRNPGPIARGTTLRALAVPEVPAGLPSEMLLRRPDVVAAEEQLVSANARIGVAKARYFPSLSLTGLLGTASGDFGKLFESPQYDIWNVGGSVLQPIFRWGEIRGQVRASEGQQRQALNSYVFSLRNAFADVENALSARANVREELVAQQNRVEALRIYNRLTEMSYNEGVATYLEFLDSQRTLFDSELQYAGTLAGGYKSVIGVYRSLGGGWVDRASYEALQPGQEVELPDR